MSMVEIERKYLLNRMPLLPMPCEAWVIEQGYFPRPDGHTSNGESIPVGRIRRAVLPGGQVICTHTIKTGNGLVRQEDERVIEQELFHEWWPLTAGCRIRKKRHRVEEGVVLWEIDQFLDDELVMAEIELSSPDEPVQIPNWLTRHVVREVTSDPAYSNFALAKSLGTRRANG